MDNVRKSVNSLNLTRQLLMPRGSAYRTELVDELKKMQTAGAEQRSQKLSDWIELDSEQKSDRKVTDFKDEEFVKSLFPPRNALAPVAGRKRARSQNIVPDFSRDERRFKHSDSSPSPEVV